MARYLACGLRLAIVLFLSGSAPAFAMPQFLQMFRSDPFRNPAFDGCNTCHMSPEGGDARNMFGQAFESAGERITTLLRAQFPDRFIYPVSKVSETLTIHFSDPNNKQVVVEAGGMKNLVDVERKTVNDTPAVFPSAPAAATSAVSGTQAAERRSEVPVDPYARQRACQRLCPSQQSFQDNLVKLRAAGFKAERHHAADTASAGWCRRQEQLRAISKIPQSGRAPIFTIYPGRDHANIQRSDFIHS